MEGERVARLEDLVRSESPPTVANGDSLTPRTASRILLYSLGESEALKMMAGRHLRLLVSITIWISTPSSAARAQQATLLGRVVVRETGQPVANASVSVLPNGAQRLASEDGSFTLRDLAPGE